MRALRLLFGLGFALTIVLGGLELGLRVAPRLVPLETLLHFHDDLRLEIATRLNLPNRQTVVHLERDDGGPPLPLFRPGSLVTHEWNDDGTLERDHPMDERGFCNPPDHPYDRDRIDIVAIGDSFTWCTGVKPSEAWPIALSGLTGRGTYNLGAPGIGTYEYLQVLKEYGLAKRPDVVVMNFFEGNDLRDAVIHWNHRDGSDDLLAADVPWQVGGQVSDGLLARHSYAFNLGAAMWISTLRPNLVEAVGIETPIQRDFGDFRWDELDFRYRLDFDGQVVPFNVDNADREEVVFATSLDRGTVDPAIFDDALREFVELGRVHGFRPVLMYSPSAYSAYAERVEFEDSSIEEVMLGYSDELRAYVREAADRFGFALLDLTPVFRERARMDGAGASDRLLYSPASVHFTAHGNRVAAEALAAFLSEGG